MSEPGDDGFEGKTAIVTGATRGIGHAIAQKLASRGCRVAFNYHSRGDLADGLTGEIRKGGGAARSYRVDVTDFEAVGKMVEDVKEHFGGVDFLVNNAGATRDKLLLTMKPEDFKQVVDVNLFGAYCLCRHVAPLMIRARSGSIVNITSVSGISGLPGQSNYSAAKAGLIGFTKALAREIGKRNVRVNALALGFIETDMTRDLDPRYQERILENIALARFGQPAEVAEAVLFLLSPAARYLTGECIRLDGGLAI